MGVAEEMKSMEMRRRAVTFETSMVVSDEGGRKEAKREWQRLCREGEDGRDYIEQ